MLAAGIASCSNQTEELTVYETVNYSTISGIWTLTELNGRPLEDGQYVYISFDRKEHTFVMYDNMSSMYSHKSTGTFSITDDYEQGVILSGEYDFSHLPLREYIVSEMTAETMKWTVRDNPDETSVYTRCTAIPEDVQSGSRGL